MSGERCANQQSVQRGGTADLILAYVFDLMMHMLLCVLDIMYKYSSRV